MRSASKILVSVFVFALLTLCTLVPASAQRYAIDGHDIPVDIMLNGSYLASPAKGYLTDGVAYAPVRGFCEALGASVEWNPVTFCAAVKKDYSAFEIDANACSCNIAGAVSFPGIRFEGNKLYAPVKFLAESLGGSISWDDYRYEVLVTLPGCVPEKKYLEQSYDRDDLLWLSRIVTCESGSVSFDAKIAVANVIINRRADPSFPSSIHDVIFDKKFGIQFPPAHNGKIYNTPSTNTILACKAALNGAETAPGCLYFSYTRDKTSWVAVNRKLFMTIGNQAFYL